MARQRTDEYRANREHYELKKLERRIRVAEKNLEELNRKRNRILKKMRFYGAEVD